MATRHGSRKEAEPSEFDVRVLSFGADPARVVRGLCDWFGIDVVSAQRLVAGGPAVLRRGLSAEEAEHCAHLLGNLGTKVRIEPAAGSADVGPPRVRRVEPANDRSSEGHLEFDVLSALDAALEPQLSEPPDRDLGRELALESSEMSDLGSAGDDSDGGEFDIPAAPRRREPAPPVPAFGMLRDAPAPAAPALGLPRNEFDLAAAHSATTAGVAPDRAFRAEFDLDDEFHASEAAAQSSNEFDLGHAAPGQEQLDLEIQPDYTRGASAAAPPAQERARPQSRRHEPAASPQLAARQRPQPTAAEKVEPRPTAAKPAAPNTNSIPLLRMLIALGVAAGGHWLDSSVFYGNAGLVSVIAHGLALQQLVLGARSLLR
jgi:hypothetical protein